MDSFLTLFCQIAQWFLFFKQALVPHKGCWWFLVFSFDELSPLVVCDFIISVVAFYSIVLTFLATYHNYVATNSFYTTNNATLQQYLQLAATKTSFLQLFYGICNKSKKIRLDNIRQVLLPYIWLNSLIVVSGPTPPFCLFTFAPTNEFFDTLTV